MSVDVDPVFVRRPEDLGPAEIGSIAAGARVELAGELIERVQSNRALARAALDDDERAVYGVNTGMGRLAERRLSIEEQAHHQQQLLIARAVGSPPWLPTRDVRGVLAVKLRTLVTGEAAASTQLCEYLAARLNDGFTPAVPREGAGCAGEIIQLCHAFQTFLGKGLVLERGAEVAADSALERGGVPKVRLGPKEGMTLLQGSPVATMHAIMRGAEAHSAIRQQLLVTACTVDAINAPRAIYDPRVAGPQDTTLAGVLEEVRWLTADVAADTRVQAPVSVRVAPHALAHARRTIDDLSAAALRMLGAVTDSPALLDGGFVSTGAYHAIDIGLRMDAVAAALVHLAEGSVQRLHRLLDERFTDLNPQLAFDPGPQAGLVVVHKRAVGELHALRRLSAPATLGTMDTSAGQEDLQAFGWAAGEQLRAATDRLLVITACEAIAACQASTLRGTRGAPALKPVRDAITEVVPVVTTDRSLGTELQRLAELLRTGLPDPASNGA